MKKRLRSTEQNNELTEQEHAMEKITYADSGHLLLQVRFPNPKLNRPKL